MTHKFLTALVRARDRESILIKINEEKEAERQDILLYRAAVFIIPAQTTEHLSLMERGTEGV